ncbi:MAG: cobalamin biosynthesis protein [Paracoccus sp. (in: a-proteobacteria)]|nr:cobalamin biosynthesis protein [Paracoccus sp. (in: a-proteobacteria)]
MTPYHRIAGFGMNSAAALPALHAALEMARGGAAMPGALACLEAHAPRLAPLADALSLPLIALAPEALRGTATLTDSARAHALYGAGSVAEACALVALGVPARLTGPRRIAQGCASCAIAERITP